MSIKEFPELSAEQESELVESLLHWCLGNGLVMYPPNFSNCSANNAPITLFPTPMPRNSFKNAEDVQKIFNELYINLVSKEREWLIKELRELSKYDSDFTGKLFEIYEEVTSNGQVPQPLSLGLFRSDYMIHNETNEIKQIEFNTVSVSFGGLSTKVGELHNYLNSSGFYDSKYSNVYYEGQEIPISNSINELAQGLADGNYFYNNQSENKDTVVLFVVQPQERNCFDQRHIEFSLLKNHGIKSYRLTLEEIESKVTTNSNKLYIKSTMDEVSVVYYRAGYSPDDYEHNPQSTWNSRLILEKSLAIKCPSILTQLSGAKKIQQLLTKKEIVEKLLPTVSQEDLKKLMSTFVSIYPLDDSEEGKIAQKLAFEVPERFVLKPQREGGGNNIYKEEIPSFLEKLDKSDWGAYILMELINPPSYKNKIIRNNEVYNENIISELGVFGSILFNEANGEIYTNKNAGWLLRSKFSSSNEGGVAAGFGCVDNIYLY
ncbi:GSH2 [[Candida] subhashii]|uniref:Glutathione synthetase n=1 Tax=[Candida] subhashii TaxID=561895 RepID=A0A8J5QLB2_9ASCO|nr:GSH2 [[Candida] subhashii]KAG7662565.1 GSH2 [[Candida] subhashii]